MLQFYIIYLSHLSLQYKLRGDISLYDLYVTSPLAIYVECVAIGGAD